MEFFRPTTWADALVIKAEHPEAVPILGGTDLMVGLNAGRSAPAALLDLTAISELRDWDRVEAGRADEGRANGQVRIGAGVTYTRVVEELAADCPALAMAARTVGSPQIRNRATIAGNLGTASPAGDSHPPLLAADATVEVESTRGARMVRAEDFYVGVKRNALEPDELIRAVRLTRKGPQQFAKVGPRSAMVIAVCSVAVALDAAERRVAVAIGSAAPTPRRCPDAEALELPWGDATLADELVGEFGRCVAAAAQPIDDVRSTASYRRHALSVLSGRALRWAWGEL